MSENNTSERNSPKALPEAVVLNGSEILIECLKEQGVKTVFGYPGGAILNIYDALYKHQGEPVRQGQLPGD